MITRINIEKQNGLFMIVNRDQIPKNWIVEIKNRKLVVIGLSNANNDRNRISEYELREGSLFLFNSNKDFYCYFRNKETQKIFDEFNIIKMASINERVFITLHVENGKVVNPITHINGFNVVERTRSNFKIVDAEREYFQVLLVFEPSREVNDVPFILQKGLSNDNKVLYLLKNKTPEEFRDKMIYGNIPELYNNNDFIFTE